MRLAQVDDVEEARELHKLAFPSDCWPGDTHTFWVATEGEDIAGMCSALYLDDRKLVYLSRAAVAIKFRGRGLQRKMIRARVKWGMEQGAMVAWTYTMLRNHSSITNLIKEGFRFDPKTRKGCHGFYLPLFLEPYNYEPTLDHAWTNVA